MDPKISEDVGKISSQGLNHRITRRDYWNQGYTSRVNPSGVIEDISVHLKFISGVFAQNNSYSFNVYNDEI